MLLATEIKSAPSPEPGCATSCGNLTIPYPFGTGNHCSHDYSFLINCNHSYNPPKPFLNLGSIEVLDISLDGSLKVASSVASDCYDKSGAQVSGTVSELTLSKFLISSTQNKFVAVGCDTYALVEGSDEWKQMSAGCVSWCDSIESVVNRTCSGIGCCQTSIPKGVKDFLVDIRSFRNHTRVKSFNPCGYAFVVEAKAFEFSSSDLEDLQNRKTIPVVLDWTVGNITCQEARKDVSSFACRANHSECIDSSTGLGYRCNCLTGFQGNPYLVDGCEDINECDTLKPCEGTCTNLEGSYSCSCPKGFEGDGKKDGAGCHHKSQINGSTLFYVVSGFTVPAVGSSWIFWRRKQKKVVKLRQDLFRRNGGLLLKYMLSSQTTPFTIFTAEDLKEATNNYDENRIHHRGSNSGITYEGILADGSNLKILIKKCHAVDGDHVEVFIHNVAILSRIQHRNVVRMIGCCLETQVPLLVYEFITSHTLHDCIHDNARARFLSWEIRLRIAAETARALLYLHSETALAQIIHGNVNSSSILLTDDYTVKIHLDPEIRLITSPQDAASLSFMGEIGYLDPEFYLCGHLTVKSDVYSFGVVLAELLTGEKAVSFERPQGEEHLPKYFISSPRDNLVRILDDRLVSEGRIEQLTEVAELAKRCLSHSSVDRPSMREAAVTLDNLISMNSCSTTISPNSSQQTTTRRVVRRNRSF
ncbi:UNVERIFIED_CONTAM: Wall-associated receptor kinase [Sesamum radiatum]|uniref:Wall-associated receptor kinase n=1 Tax=Sesamum radiatum TaxID=300843 RepID=A0AAW2M5F7_SESRA